jgi:hypothetical protein
MDVKGAVAMRLLFCFVVKQPIPPAWHSSNALRTTLCVLLLSSCGAPKTDLGKLIANVAMPAMSEQLA